MLASLLVLVLVVGGVLGLAGPTFGAPAITPALFDFVTFDGIDYVRWEEEPGRPLAPRDLGAEFGTIGCSFGEDFRGCPYGSDAGAAFMPAGTRMYAVRGYATEFRLAAVWKDRIFLYQAWRNPRARVGRRPLRSRRQSARHRRGGRRDESRGAPPVDGDGGGATSRRSSI